MRLVALVSQPQQHVPARERPTAVSLDHTARCRASLARSRSAAPFNGFSLSALRRELPQQAPRIDPTKATNMADTDESATPTDTLLAGVVSLKDVPWPAAVAVPNPVDGEPATRTLSFIDEKDRQAGAWTCTPGAFRSDHSGYVEFMHIVGGRAQLVGDDGVIFSLEPGTMFLIPAGWTGTWNVTETVTKSFAIFRD